MSGCLKECQFTTKMGLCDSQMVNGNVKMRQDNVHLKKKSCSRYVFLPAQLAPVNPVLQVHVPVEPSQVPWEEQLSGQVLSVR